MGRGAALRLRGGSGGARDAFERLTEPSDSPQAELEADAVFSELAKLNQQRVRRGGSGRLHSSGGPLLVALLALPTIRRPRSHGAERDLRPQGISKMGSIQIMGTPVPEQSAACCWVWCAQQSMEC